jgi:hypothetical protein
MEEAPHPQPESHDAGPDSQPPPLRKFLIGLACLASGMLLMWSVDGPPGRRVNVDQLPWQHRIQTDLASTNNLHRVEGLRAEFLLDGEATARALDVKAHDAPWGEQIAIVDPAPIVVRLETRIDPDWYGRRGVITYHFQVVWPEIEQSPGSGQFVFNEKTARFGPVRTPLYFTRTGERVGPPRWLFLVCRFSGLAVFLYGAYLALRYGRRYWLQWRRTPWKGPPVPVDLEALPAFRAAQERIHRRRARWWILGIIVGNALVGIGAIWGLVRAFEIRAGFMFVATLGLFWPIAAWLRAFRSREIRRADGYAISFADEILLNPAAPAPAFGLFLRAFDMEKEHNSYRGVNEDVSTSDAGLEARPVEHAVVSALAMPVVGLADPRDTAPMPGVHRFARVPDDWQALVHRLVSESRVIVMHLTMLTPGIIIEINHLRGTSHLPKTLVILGRNLKKVPGVTDAMLGVLLNVFPHVIREQEGLFWSRAEERAFHKRLTEVLARMEQGVPGPPLVHPGASIEPTIPHPVRLVVRFLLGPLITTLALYVLYGVMEVVGLWDGSLSREVVVRNMTDVLWFLPFFLVFFTVAKGWYMMMRAVGAVGLRARKKLWNSFRRKVLPSRPTVSQPPPLPTAPRPPQLPGG